jgi:hypothetical protein
LKSKIWRNNLSKEKEIAESFESFFSNFGKIDDITQIVIEEVFKQLFNQPPLKTDEE